MGVVGACVLTIAYQALFLECGLKEGEKVMVHAVSQRVLRV